MKSSSTGPDDSGPRVELERVDRKEFHGWVVIVWRGRKARLYRFAERSYETPSAAYAAAVRRRDRVVGNDAGRPSKPRTKKARPRSPVGSAELERVDRDGFHGWVVIVGSGREARVYRFAEGIYPHSSFARAAAVRFRDRAVENGPGSLLKAAKEIPGISLGTTRTTSGRIVKHYQALVYGPDGTPQYAVFSWMRHGMARALELARKALKEMRAEARRTRERKPSSPTTRRRRPVARRSRNRSPPRTRTFVGSTVITSTDTSSP